MLSWVISAPIDTGDTWLSEIVAGLEITAIGMAVVFSVLILLYLLLSLLGRFLAVSEPGPLAPAVDGAGELTPPQPLLAVEATEQSNAEPALRHPAADELSAVIMAAIAAASSTPSSINGAEGGRSTLQSRPSRWAAAGRIEQVAVREAWQEMRGR